ncbi:hypothetical protein CEP52_005550 [Fusarium oligoseptatum]|uniref:Uncharacterized protein n=1 Tax=Fusarium oligoseptatum TaxID=2604345 RepID=A0A428TXG0_9HYPO|nr:hypothetical protein CEP52_005550 [Fusarium oligoseptatum]
MASRLLPRAAFIQSVRESSYSLPVRPEFLASTSAKLVNPRGHIINTDTVTQTFSASVVAGLSDERVLSLFTSGFFGGFVFGFERFILRIGGYNLLPSRYTGFEIPPDVITIWNRANVPNTHLLPVGSCFFGSFLLLAKHITTLLSSEEPSYVDYGFGSDEFVFGGCHRFQITRLPVVEKEEAQIQIELQHFRCNPQKNQPPVAEYIERFHYVYAKMLFANGVQALLSR